MRIPFRSSLAALALGASIMACGADSVTYPGDAPPPVAGTVKPPPTAVPTSTSPSTLPPSPSPSASPSPTPTPSTTPTAPPSGTPAPSGTAPAPPAPTGPALVPLYVGFHQTTGDWIMSRVNGEGAPAYAYTGVQMRVFDAAPPTGTSAPLYRCIDGNGTHFQTNSATCEGVGTLEGLLGFVYSTPVSTTEKAIYRCIGAAGKPIISTLAIGDCSVGGFIVQGTIGYAFAP